MKIAYKGPTLDPSGYGQAARAYVTALFNHGADLTVVPWNFEKHSPEFYGEEGVTVENLKNRFSQYDADVVVHHYVPNQVEPAIVPGAFNVGYNTWETTLIPPHWVENINNHFDLQLVPSYFNKRVYKRSGVTIPIEVVPHCFDVSSFETDDVVELPGLEDRFKFLSVFQWTERKNPIGLLKAFFSEFTYDDPVCLVIKAYGSNTTTSEQQRLRNSIKHLRDDMRLSKLNTAPVYLIGNLLSRERMLALYNTSDAFVLPTRGEGFGMPIAEAIAAKLPVITTNFGGQTEFTRRMYTYLLPYQLTPVAHMPWIPHYNGKQHWADPDLMALQTNMRTLLNQHEHNRQIMAKMARNEMSADLSYKRIAREFMDKIKEHSGLN